MTKPAGRRLGERVPTRTPADVIDANDHMTRVMIVDLSRSGARLEIPFDCVLPARFLLRFGREGHARPAELVWRKGYDAAARFIEADAEPSRPVLKVVPATKIAVADLRKLVKK